MCGKSLVHCMHTILHSVKDFAKQQIFATCTADGQTCWQFKERAEKTLRNTPDGTPLSGDGKTPRLDMGGMLGEWKIVGTHYTKRMFRVQCLEYGSQCRQTQRAHTHVPTHTCTHSAHEHAWTYSDMHTHGYMQTLQINTTHTSARAHTQIHPCMYTH